MKAMSVCIRFRYGIALELLTAALLLSLSFVRDQSASAGFSRSSEQVRSANLRRERQLDGVVTIADTESALRVKANVEKFNRCLEQLDRQLAQRKHPGIQLDVTELFKPALPESRKIADAIRFFHDVDLSPFRASNNEKNFVVFELPGDRLVDLDHVRFLSGDRLVISFTTASSNVDAEILSFRVVLQNDASL